MSEIGNTPHSGVRPRRPLLAASAIALLAVGGAAGAFGARLVEHWSPQRVMLLQPSPINKLESDTPVAVKGNVAEIFGNKFIIEDQSGRTLVDLGPRGERADVVAKGETLTVQGHFDRGVIHAQLISHADGRSEAFGPPRPPRPDRGPPGPDGPEHGPPPPPPPPAATPDASPTPMQPPAKP